MVCPRISFCSFEPCGWTKVSPTSCGHCVTHRVQFVKFGGYRDYWEIENYCLSFFLTSIMERILKWGDSEGGELMAVGFSSTPTRFSRRKVLRQLRLLNQPESMKIRKEWMLSTWTQQLPHYIFNPAVLWNQLKIYFLTEKSADMFLHQLEACSRSLSKTPISRFKKNAASLLRIVLVVTNYKSIWWAVRNAHNALVLTTNLRVSQVMPTRTCTNKCPPQRGIAHSKASQGNSGLPLNERFRVIRIHK